MRERLREWGGSVAMFVLLGAASAMGQTAREIEDVFWEDALCEREAEMRAYLEAYPDGVYVSEAQACLEQTLGLTRQERVAVQRGLGELGQAPGPADGLFGGSETKTRRAIRGWQAAKGMGATGYLDREQAEVLIAAGQAVEARERAAAEQAAAADDAAYAAADQGDTAATYGEYLEAYPAGRHASAARERQAARRAAAARAAEEEAARQAAAADDAAYAAAEQGDTAAAYGEYLEAYPAGRHVTEARDRRAARREAEAYRVGRTFRDPLRSGGAGPEMVVVPAGTFRMGGVSRLFSLDPVMSAEPVHQVTIWAAFAVGVHEVTFAEWDACVRAGGCGGHRPDDEGWGRGEQPVINVNWEDAQAYVAWLSQESGAGYRLLSEAEWEYVTRAGSETRYSWGDAIGRNRANCAGCGSRWDDERTAPVGSFGANGFGVYDVHGNVLEWVEDCWSGDYLIGDYVGAPTDGTAWTSGDCSVRVGRGGSWLHSPGFLRSAHRDWYSTELRHYYLGFRVARSVTP